MKIPSKAFVLALDEENKKYKTGLKERALTFVVGHTLIQQTHMPSTSLPSFDIHPHFSLSLILSSLSPSTLSTQRA